MAFRGLQAESANQGEAHKAIAKELHTLVADPFDEWAQGHKVRAGATRSLPPLIGYDAQERIKQSKAAMIDQYLWAYEHSHSDVCLASPAS